MPHSVDRLKELLFDRETQTLSEISSRLDEVFARAGTSERLQDSVAGVLGGALRKAEVDRHAELADALAPLMVRTIRTEIRNSRDELVEALYPMTGRMVQAYVASALKDLANDINRRLDANPVMLRLKSLTSGRSVAEIAMAEAQALRIEELYLVRRGTGELMGRWPEAADASGRDQAMSGILTAINEFSSEALQDQGSALRQIDIGDRQLYLRASQNYLLAAKCSGVAPTAVESILDEAFLDALERLHGDDGQPGSGARRSALLGDVSQRLDGRINEQQAALSASGVRPLTLLLWLVGLPLALWLGWTVYANYRTERAHLIASRVLAETEALRGYPTEIKIGRLGYTVTIEGLAPSPTARDALVERLRRALPATEVRDRLNVLPSELAALEPAIESVRSDIKNLAAGIEPRFEGVKSELGTFKGTVEPRLSEIRAAVSAIESKFTPELSGVRRDLAGLEAAAAANATERALDRARLRLNEAAGELAALEPAAGEAREEVARQARQLSEARDLIGSPGGHPALQGLDEARRRLRGAGDTLSGLISGAAQRPPAAPGAETSGAGTPLQGAELLAAEADRLAAITLVVGQALRLKQSIPKPVVSVREQLEALTRRTAVFFVNDTDYGDVAATERALDGIANLLRQGDDVLRVVGYTDEKGRSDGNTTLSVARARKVADDLVARGLNERRFVVVGRLNAIDLSPVTGAASPNRRVEFELGFDGEPR